MIAGHVFIATSLDGFIARADNSLDWLMKQDSGSGGDFETFMDSVDGLVMGAGTFRTVLGFGEWVYRKPVVVLSRSMTTNDIPGDLKEKVRLSTAAPQEVMAELEAEGWRNVYVDGGRVIQSFLREGLIETLTVTLAPVLIGDGIPLFASLPADIDLDLVSAERLGANMLKTQYRVRTQFARPDDRAK